MSRKRMILAAAALVVITSLYGTAAYATTKTKAWDTEPGAHTSTFGFSGANQTISEKTASSARAYFEDTNLDYASPAQQYQLQVKNALGYFVSEGNVTVNKGSTGKWNNRAAGEYLIQLNGFNTGSVGWVYNAGYDWSLNASMSYTY